MEIKLEIRIENMIEFKVEINSYLIYKDEGFLPSGFLPGSGFRVSQVFNDLIGCQLTAPDWSEPWRRRLKSVLYRLCTLNWSGSCARYMCTRREGIFLA